MPKLERITITGFRGILAPLTIDLLKAGKPSSVIVYGRNGTGKSSITDAWEWLRTSRIEHLAREGAEHSAYPHMGVGNDPIFVEVTFDNARYGTCRQTFNRARITRPTQTGDFQAFQALAPHPCHVRFADLARFVYLTKADRYDLLAQLMGFSAQVSTQKVLRRVESRIREMVVTNIQRLREFGADFKVRTGIAVLAEKEVLEHLVALLKSHGMEAENTLKGIAIGSEQMRKALERDPVALRLSHLKQLGKAVKDTRLSPGVLGAVKNHGDHIRAFREQEEQFRKLLLTGLYQKGLEVLQTGMTGDDCPLCGQRFPGDLKAHVATELATLSELQEEYGKLEATRKTTLAALRSTQISVLGIREALENLKEEPPQDDVVAVSESGERLNLSLVTMIPMLDTPSENVDADMVTRHRLEIQKAAALSEEFGALREVALQRLSAVVKELESDPKRGQLVKDFEVIARGLDDWPKLLRQAVALRNLRAVAKEFQVEVDRYSTDSVADVTRRFAEISGKVTLYFEILEAHSPGIGRPVLRIVPDQDRAVVLDVEFFGHEVSPAYRCLSESQLNSFGLAVFLASVEHFNREFPFLILDDVVNSLDGYKRPQLIKILREHFAGHQVILLTHDSVWRDKLTKELLQWKRLHFKRFEFGVGPIVAEPRTTLEEVESLTQNDEPRRAGQILGPYMEDELQDLCEAFEVEVKYNRRNEYTIDPLLDRLRVRVQSKLTNVHPLTQALVALQNETGFRNLCAHAKNPEIDLTPVEMTTVVAAWKTVESHVRCQEAACGAVLHWDEPVFRCPCGKSVLRRP